MGHETIISTGRAGLVGSRVEQLTRGRLNWGPDLDIKGLYPVDITNEDQVKEVVSALNAGIIIHLAAYTDVGGAWRQSMDPTGRTGDLNGSCYKVNVTGTRNVAEAAARNKMHMIHVSTDFVYGGQTPEPLTEETQPDPAEWYGRTKLEAEKIVAETVPSHTIIRIGYPFRADFPGKPDYVRTIQQGLRNGALYPQFGNNTTTPTFVDDIAKAIEVIVEQRPQGIVHVTGSTSLSSYDLAINVATRMGIDPELVRRGDFFSVYGDGKRPYPQHLRMSNDLAKNEFSIPLRDIDSVLNEFFHQQTSTG